MYIAQCFMHDGAELCRFENRCLDLSSLPIRKHCQYSVSSKAENGFGTRRCFDEVLEDVIVQGRRNAALRED